jgi:hypothetical protein
MPMISHLPPSNYLCGGDMLLEMYSDGISFWLLRIVSLQVERMVGTALLAST